MASRSAYKRRGMGGRAGVWRRAATQPNVGTNGVTQCGQGVCAGAGGGGLRGNKAGALLRAARTSAKQRQHGGKSPFLFAGSGQGSFGEAGRVHAEGVGFTHCLVCACKLICQHQPGSSKLDPNLHGKV